MAAPARLPQRELLGGGRDAQRRQRVERRRVQRGERARALPDHRDARGRERGVGQQLLRPRLAGHPVHQEAAAEIVAGLEHRPHGGHRHAGRRDRAQQRGLVLRGERGERPVLGHAAAAGLAAQDQRHRAAGPGRVEGPGLVVRAAGQPLDPLHGRGVRQDAPREREQLRLHARTVAKRRAPRPGAVRGPERRAGRNGERRPARRARPAPRRAAPPRPRNDPRGARGGAVSSGHAPEPALQETRHGRPGTRRRP